MGYPTYVLTSHIPGKMMIFVLLVFLFVTMNYDFMYHFTSKYDRDSNKVMAARNVERNIFDVSS